MQSSHDQATSDEAWTDPKSAELSEAFVGRWSQLISTTNWEKGRIIQEWRRALIESAASAATYSDEAWSRRVGGVTPQHIGRLRRVYERFGDSYASYRGLYWSHFLAAIDWEDAEMWLEGAAQSQWSVSCMREMRWEANGSDPSLDPSFLPSAPNDDEDELPAADAQDALSGARDQPRDVTQGPRYDDPDFGDADAAPIGSAVGGDESWEDEPQLADGESPFANLPKLPTDVAEAFDTFKLCIIRHRADAWVEVSQADLILALQALQAFAKQ